MSILEDDEVCKSLIHKVQESLDSFKDTWFSYREPFATLSHKDMWINNFMVRLEEGKIVENKFVDFQGFTYESPVRDLLFFLFTSVQIDTLKEHLDYLLKFYHEQFIKTLENLKCPIGEFSFGKLMDEIREYCLFDMYHLLFMMVLVVFGKKIQNEDGEVITPHFIPKESIPMEVRERAWWVFKECYNRKWIGN